MTRLAERAAGQSPPLARRIMIACGEASGDLYAAALTHALRARVPDIEVFGLGGPALAAAGADLVADYRGMTVTGLAEAMAVIPRSLRTLRVLEQEAAMRRPAVLVAIDFPDFNFRLLPKMARLGIPVVYYVSPQLWAWRPGRLKTIQRYVKQMLVIFPFERQIYEPSTVPVEFVGHPMVDLVSAARGSDTATAPAMDPTRPVVALLPGSRPNEVGRLLPVLLDAAVLVEQAIPGARFVIARAPALEDRLFAPASSRALTALSVIDGAADRVLASADVVVTASGTATVQTALHGKPMVIVYRLSSMTYALARRFIRLSTFGMVNLVAGRAVVPELIQGECTPANIAREVLSLLTDDARAETMRRDLADVRRALGGGGASERAADAILRVVRLH